MLGRFRGFSFMEETGTKNEKLLKEIRDNYDYHCASWDSIRKEAKIDVCLATGRPWDMTEETRKDKQARISVGRPVLALDEISQYVNQYNNSFRTNKRAIKLQPVGEGADEKNAEFKAGMIRQIEYQSNAQSAYICAAESAGIRGYGWARVAKKFYDDTSFDLELCIKRIPNPDNVCPDPDFQEADASDMKWLFFLDSYTEKEFEQNWTDAKVKSFTPELASKYPKWINNKRIQVAEYWRVETKKRILIQLNEKIPPQFLGEIGGAPKIKGKNLVYPDGVDFPILKQREVQDRSIVQYITNGIEILEKKTWDGQWIPFVPVFGKEVFVDRGSGPQRELFSLIRLARDPVMLYCFARTNQSEVASMTPKSKWMVLEGQIGQDDLDDWANAHKLPKAFLKYQVVTDPSTGQPIIKAPERVDYEPPIQALEMLAESARRAIQASLGQTALPTSAQRLNEKSGVALKQIENMQQVGSFHFHDNFNVFLMHLGRILNEQIDINYDTTREVGIREEDDNYKMVGIRGEPMEGQEQPYKVGQGKYDITVTVGPSFQSQHEEAGAFVDTLVQNLRTLPIPPPVAIQLLAKLVRMKQLGPVGDQIVKLLEPEQGEQQTQAMLGQMKQHIEMLQKGLIPQLQAKIAELEREKQGKVLENQSKEKIAALEAQTEKFKIVVQALTKAEELTSKENIAGLQASAEQLQAQISALAQPAEGSEMTQ